MSARGLVSTVAPRDSVDRNGWNDFGSVEGYERRWMAFFENPEIDEFEVNRGLNHAFVYDIVPTIPVLEAALRATRRTDSPALAARIFHALRQKCTSTKQYTDYVAHLQPLKDSLGVLAPEEFGRL
jgi:cytochrome c oxidase subunit 5a